MKKIVDKIILLLLIFIPFWEIYFSQSLFFIILKDIIFGMILFYVIKKEKDKKIFGLLIFYFLIYLIFIFRNNNLNFFLSLNSLINIFYLPILILGAVNYKNEYINSRILSLLFLGYGVYYLIFKEEIISILILMLPIVIWFLNKSNSYLLKIGYGLLIFFLALVINNINVYFVLGIILFYFLDKMIWQKKYFNQFKVGLLVIAILLVLIGDISKNNIVKDLPNMNVASTVKNSFFADHLTRLESLKNYYKENGNLEKLMGNGFIEFESGIDLFDIGYSLGLIGLGFYFVLFIYALKKAYLVKEKRFSFLTLVILSFTLGNVLTNISVSFYLASLILLSKNAKDDKKDILLVSNMYPSRQYPHYGSFVKNTYEVLKNANFSIDLITISKCDSKIKKLITYFKFGLKSFYKSCFYNYDYIYVHFISHSTIGVFIPYLTMKNTKLILNVHGNDVVSDTKADQKNIFFSRIFLKYASKVIVPSNYFKNILIKEYKVKKEKIVIYPSGGVDFTKFKKISKKDALKNANLDSKYKYFGFISRLEKDKGYDTLLKAIYDLKGNKKLKNIKFLVVGSGEEEKNFDELVNKYDLNSYILKRPLISQEELVNIYNAIEVLIYPTRRKSESLGLTALEAMATETLVIGPNMYGPSSYLNKTNSLVFNPFKVKELDKQILYFLDLKAKEKNVLIKNGLLTSQEYDKNKINKIIIDVFSK